MQHKKISGSLALATCSLLGSSFTGIACANENGDWDIDLHTLYYSEVDRVTVFEPVLKIKKAIEDEEFFSAQVALDSMSGASANGATASDTRQSFTTASGDDYEVEANETPVRDFSDTRVALNLEWEKPLQRNFKMILGGHASREKDYTSTGGAATFSFDMNTKLTTLTAGSAYTSDTIEPNGGAPEGLQIYQTGQSTDNESKNTTDYMVGVTQVLNRKTLTQLNYTHSQVEGYQTDPYKIVSLVDGTTGTTTNYRYEKRPDSRSINIIYWKLVHQLTDDVVQFSYRYFYDDWEIKSHTAEIKYRLEFTPKTYLQPFYRYYKQSAAKFYRHSMVDSEPVPDHVSADYRLGEMKTQTIGLKYGGTFENYGDFSARIGYMRQDGESNPDDAVGLQKQQDLFPTVEAYIFHLALRVVF